MNLNHKAYLTACAALLFSLSLIGQGNVIREFEGPDFLKQNSPISDSLIQLMSLEEKIGQLFMVAAWSNKEEGHALEIEKLIEKNHIGGLIFFQGGPERQRKLYNRYQSKSAIPLMIGMDAEWGLAMRLDSTLRYPYQMTLGAISNDSLIYEMGASIARQMNKLGVHVSFSPVADVNNNANNPVINYRSFGENVEKVAKKSHAYASGLQNFGVLANAKHFPGHGDTDVDSHKDLPIIAHDKSRLDSLELMPFKYLISRGIASVMVAHLYIPELDSTANQASTLSKLIVDSLLKKELGFNGLIFTDALNMHGVSKFYEPGETDEKALIAGNDVLLFSLNVEKAMNRIAKALADNKLLAKEVDNRVHKILKAKEYLGLFESHSDTIKFESASLSDFSDLSLIERLYSEAVTLIKNEENYLPLQRYSKKERGLVIVGDYLDNTYHKELKGKKLTHSVAVKKDLDKEKIQAVLKKLEGIEDVIVNIHGMNQRPSKNFGIQASSVALIDSLNKHHRVILNVFGNPYSLSKYPSLLNCSSIFILYEDNEFVQKAAIKALFGDANILGTLPVSVNADFTEGTGIRIKHDKLTYGFPEEVGMSANTLHLIDSIALDGLSEQAYPGCVILVAKDEKIVYHKAFGNYTFEGRKEVEPHSIYDLASITKIAATAPAIMKLSEDGLIDLNRNVGYYLSEIADSCFVHSILLKDLMTHQAGLKPWIPFYLQTMEKGKYKKGYYSSKPTEEFNVQVSEKLWINQNYRDSIFTKIYNSQPRKKRDYKYSDLGFYLLPQIVERITKQDFESYVQAQFFKPLGIESLVYNPLEVYRKEEIVPTEHDLYFRKELLQGHVHDMGAAMLGGVSGHAGLFGNAYDLAVYMQMLLNKGEYNDIEIFKQSTIDQFTACQNCDGTKKENRRGLIFDKPSRFEEEGPTCFGCISHDSFGHSGFTGTLAWADPEEEIVYIFLSNRVYPNMKNKKLIKMNIRTKIMEAIYKSLEDSPSISDSQ